MTDARALSLRQPWLHFIMQFPKAPKRIENRRRLIFKDWQGSRFFLHAAKGDRREEWGPVLAWVMARFPEIQVTDFPEFQDVARGGLVGRTRVVGLILPDGTPERGSKIEGVDLRWHIPGQYGYVLANVEKTSFVPVRGMLGLFALTASEVAAAGA